MTPPLDPRKLLEGTTPGEWLWEPFNEPDGAFLVGPHDKDGMTIVARVYDVQDTCLLTEAPDLAKALIEARELLWFAVRHQGHEGDCRKAGCDWYVRASALLDSKSSDHDGGPASPDTYEDPSGYQGAERTLAGSNPAPSPKSEDPATREVGR